MPVKEIGSYFHWMDEIDMNIHPDDQSESFKEAFRLFYSGRHALKFLISHIKNQKKVRYIWMPEYYCQHVARWMGKNYSNLRFYETPPFVFSSPADLPLEADHSDIVIVNNYWGLSTMPEVDKLDHHRPTIIEDHSHGWLTQQSFESSADYCFISLRKSLPIPLGGICWKPGGHLPDYTLPENSEVYDTWDLMTEAMQCKQNFLKGDKKINKENYLFQIAEVEKGLDRSLDPIRMREEDKAYILKWMKFDLLRIKAKHLSYLYEHLPSSNYFKIIKRDSYSAFGLMLLLENQEFYDSFRAHLVDHKIYPSNLWPENRNWSYFLNIHVDFRYNLNDMDYILNCIREWTTDNP